MKAIKLNAHLFGRGKSRIFYLRPRIPKRFHPAYPPGKTEIVINLKTRDRKEQGGVSWCAWTSNSKPKTLPQREAEYR